MIKPSSCGIQVRALCGRLLKDMAVLVPSVAVVSYGQLFVSGSQDKIIKLWNTTTGGLQQTLQAFDPISSVAFASHDELIASGSVTSIKLWITTTGDLQQTFAVYGLCLAFSPYSNLLISGRYDGGVQLWDVTTNDKEVTHEEILRPNIIRAAAFSSNGKILAISRQNDLIELWNTSTNDKRLTFEGRVSAGYSTIGFSPDDTLQVTNAEYVIEFWGTATGSLQHSIETEDAMTDNLAFSSDGNVLATCNKHGELILWDLASGIIQKTFEIGPAHCLAFSSNDKLLASASYPSLVKVWNISMGNLQQETPLDGWPTHLMTFVYDPYILKLWFHPEIPCLLSNRGIIEIQGGQTDISNQSCQRDFIFMVRKWITWNEERLMWVPPEYHVGLLDCKENMMVVTRDKSDQFSLIEIDFSKP